MVSRENRIILGCGALAMVLSYAAAWLDLPGPVVLAVLLGVGVVAPFLVNERLDIGDDAAAERE
jgi:hypothetical protein